MRVMRQCADLPTPVSSNMRSWLPHRHVLRVPDHDLAFEQALISKQCRACRPKAERGVLDERSTFANGAIEILVMDQLRVTSEENF